MPTLLACAILAAALGWTLPALPLPALAALQLKGVVIENRLYRILDGGMAKAENRPHSKGHIGCSACEALRKMLMPELDFPAMTFAQAAPLWLRSRQPYISARTNASYEYYLTGLTQFFGELTLRDIHIGHIREYQRWRAVERTREYDRADGGKRSRVWKANASCINHEVNTLQQILKRAGLWGALQDYYEPIPLPRWTPPRVIDDAAENRLFETAASKDDWLVAYCCASITVNTTASGCELKGLRRKNIDLDGHQVFIPSDAVKNEFRARVIPLNERAELQFRRLLQRGEQIGSYLPDHYLLPFRVQVGKYDPTKHQTSWRTAWYKIRAGAGMPWLRAHDLRHQAVTKLLENPEVSEQTAKHISGHISQQMLQHYSHARKKAASAAVMALTPKPAQPSRGMRIAATKGKAG